MTTEKERTHCVKCHKPNPNVYLDAVCPVCRAGIEKGIKIKFERDPSDPNDTNAEATFEYAGERHQVSQHPPVREPHGDDKTVWEQGTNGLIETKTGPLHLYSNENKICPVVNGPCLKDPCLFYGLTGYTEITVRGKTYSTFKANYGCKLIEPNI